MPQGPHCALPRVASDEPVAPAADSLLPEHVATLPAVTRHPPSPRNHPARQSEHLGTAITASTELLPVLLQRAALPADAAHAWNARSGEAPGFLASQSLVILVRTPQSYATLPRLYCTALSFPLAAATLRCLALLTGQ